LLGTTTVDRQPITESLWLWTYGFRLTTYGWLTTFGFGLLNLRMRKILVTGANGFTGFYLVRQLLQKNFMVIAAGRGECRLPFEGPDFIYEPMDFTNEVQSAQVFQKHRPDVVVHGGAISKPDECEQNRGNAFLNNVTGTIYLLRHARLYGSFFIFISTDFVFDGEKGMYVEDDPRGPVNYYGETKLIAEDEVIKYPFDWAIVRTVLVYGKPLAARQNLLTSTAQALAKGEQPKIFNDQVRTPTFVEDLASGIVSIIEKNASGIYHISGEDVRTPYDMAVAVARHLGYDENLIQPVTADAFHQPARRPLKTGFDLSKARKDLGYNPVSFDEGLKRTFE
jgi:dTDP-4-dehydrorhamnose reductase